MKKFISIILATVMVLSVTVIVNAADFSGGVYNFVCVDGGRYLNVYAGKDADGTNVCVWERDGSPEQNYTISACGGGKYKLYPASSSSRVIDVNRGNSYNNPLKAGLNVDLWRTNDAPAQEFYITHVGNNLYKIELAALPGHVLQANNPGKNNGNVTLERYTGASNQHWEILENGTQVTEPCTHNSVSSRNERISYTQKNDNTHNVTKTYDNVCDDCGKTIKSGVTETTTESHSLSGNNCSKCGYEVITQKCAHSKTYDDVKSYIVAQKNDTYHTVTDTYDVYCSDCKELIKKDATRTYDEKHTIGNDICKKCNYTVPGLEASKCKHTNTAKHMSENKESVISIKDDNQHTIATYYNLYCTDCNTYIDENLSDIVDEEHKFVNNICSVCNLEKKVEKPGNSDLSIEKTNYTLGETILATWTRADGATSYELHIETIGDGLTYKIERGIAGTSKSFAINDEGSYRLVIYSVNSSGYTKGGAVDITVKKAVERTKTANEGLYNIQNASSGYMMNVYAGKDANGTKVTMWENDNSNDQKIYISYQGEGKYLLKYNSSNNGRVIDVNRGNSMAASIDEGDKIDIWTSNDPEAQLFYINDFGGGRFTFELASKPGYVLSPVSASAANKNGAQIELKKYVNEDYQKWYIMDTENIRKTAYVYNTEGLRLNVRSSYSTKSSIVAKIPEYAAITVIGEKINGFYPIEYDGNTGYAHSEYITFSVPQREEKITAWVYKTGTDNLNVRSEAIIKEGNIIGSFSPNQQITVVGRTVQNGFYKVKYGNGTAYASAAYISFSKPIAANSTASSGGNKNTASASSAQSAINPSQTIAPKGEKKISFIKASYVSAALETQAQAAKLYHDVVCDVNARLAAENALGTTLGAILTKNPSQIFGVFNVNSGLGVMAMAANDEFYRNGKYYHQQFLSQIKNVTNLQQAEAAFKSFREAMAYYGAVQALNKSTVEEYRKKGHYTKRMLDSFFTALADAALPTDDIKFLSKAAKVVATGGELLNLIMNNSSGADAARDIRIQWNNTWEKLN